MLIIQKTKTFSGKTHDILILYTILVVIISFDLNVNNDNGTIISQLPLIINTSNYSY